jgi:hypothetical protein
VQLTAVAIAIGVSYGMLSSILSGAVLKLVALLTVLIVLQLPTATVCSSSGSGDGSRSSLSASMD